MKFEKIKSHAKINLSLNVLGKKKSKLHNLETIVGFLDLHDDIYIKKTNKKNKKNDPNAKTKKIHKEKPMF